MTAEEARQKTEEVIQIAINMGAVYEFIDDEIEKTINNGEYVATIHLDTKDVPYNGVLYRREAIKVHYKELGYVVTSLGFKNNVLNDVLNDVFEISWRNNSN